MQLRRRASPTICLTVSAWREPQNTATSQQGGPCDQTIASIFGGRGAQAAASGFEPRGFQGPYASTSGLDRSQADGPLPNQWGHLLGYSAHLYGSQVGVSDTQVYVPDGFTNYLPPSGSDAIAQFYYPELGGQSDVTLAVFHVHGFGIRRNDRNAAGSVRIGTSGLNNQHRNYRHTHLEVHRGWPAPMSKKDFNKRNETRIFFPNLFCK
jgi:hypothetical protein